MVARHNELNLTEPMPVKIDNFFNRPFKVVNAEGVVASLIKQIKDREILRLTEKPLIGNIDFISDNTDFVSNKLWRMHIRRFFE